MKRIFLIAIILACLSSSSVFCQAITGTFHVCVGDTALLSDTASGGSWSSSAPAIAMIDSATGMYTGMSSGTVVITYFVGSDTDTITITVYPLPVAGSITGPATVCAGLSITLVDTLPGGAWSSSNASATIAGGTVTGVMAGVDTITYAVTNGCGTAIASQVVSIVPLPVAGIITGPSAACVGAAITLADTVAAGAWTSANATASVSGGAVSGVAPGIDTIIYSVTTTCGIASVSAIITVSPLPVAGTITGAASICPGTSIALLDTITGGVWARSNAHATVDSTGLVTGVSRGRDTIRYVVSNLCGVAVARAIVTVDPLPDAGAITGTDSVCMGATVPLSDAAPGGMWYSSNTVCATVDSTGLVSGVVFGTSVISYVVSNHCGADTAMATVKIQLPVLPIIGDTSVCQGQTLTLIDPISDGLWLSSNYLVAPVLPVLIGEVYGLSAGTATITYTVNNACGSSSATLEVTVLSTAECTAGVYASPAVKEALEIFPNPNNGTFTINLSSGIDAPVSVEVTNMLGEQLSAFTTITNKQSEIKLNAPSGIYFISASTINSRYMARVNIAR